MARGLAGVRRLERLLSRQRPGSSASVRAILGQGHRIRRWAPGGAASGQHAVRLSPAASRGPAVVSLGSNGPAKLSRLEPVRRTELPLPGSGRERRQRLHGNAAARRRPKLLMLRVSRQEHFSRLSCLPEGFRGGLLYFMKMESTEQVKSQGGWFDAGSKKNTEGFFSWCPTRAACLLAAQGKLLQKGQSTPGTSPWSQRGPGLHSGGRATAILGAGTL